MNAVPEIRDFRRILVALDASKESLAALETAAGLAARLEAELVGLFVEDTDLLNLAALPFAREASTLWQSGRVMDPERLERELRAKAAMARQALARAAEALSVQWSFRMTRGRVEAELLAAAQDVDLVAVGKGTRPLSGQVRIGRSTRAVAVRTMCSMLFASPAGCPGDAPVAVIYDGTAGSSRALVLAGRLAERQGKRLIVFVAAESAAVSAQRELAVRERMKDIGIVATIRRVRGAGLPDIVPALRAEPVGLLVVAAEGADLDLIVEKSACSVLLVRG